MADFKGIFRTLFPFISLAASAGGPLGTMAAAAVGKALGIDKVDPTPEGIEKTIATAQVTDPDALLKLKQAEQEFALEMKQLDLDSEEKLEAIAAGDRASARDREKTVRDHTPEIAFYALLIGFFGALGCLFKFPIPADNKAVIFTMVGSIGALTMAAGNYFYGTSRGSERKTELLALSEPVKPVAAK